MATPTPSGITANEHNHPWYYVTWDDVSGTGVRYECQHEGESHVSELRKPETSILAISQGTTRYTKIRNIVDDVPSGWVTVTLNDRGEIIDIDGGDEHPKPGAPTGLRVDSMDVARRTAAVSWATAPDAAYWMVRITALGGHWHRADGPDSTLTQLVGGVEYTWQVKAVADYNGTLVESAIAEDTFLFQDEQPPPEQPPKPPAGLRLVSTDPEYSSATVAWAAQADAAYWEIVLDDVYPRPRKANTSEYTFSDLTDGQTYGWRVRAVRTGSGGKLLRSAWTRDEFTYQEQKPPQPPATPKNVRAHCITYQSSKVEWDRDAVVHEYEVWLDGQEESAQVTQNTLVTVVGLEQNTSYTARVVARTRDGQQSEPGSVTFTTGVPEPEPDPDPEVPVAADWPAPGLTVWPLENGRVRASWSDPDDGRKPKQQMGYPFWHVSLDQKTWYFTRTREFEFEVTSGGAVQVSVYGVWDHTLTAIATKGVAL